MENGGAEEQAACLKMDVETEDTVDKTSTSTVTIQYSNVKVLKHENDICRTNKSSARSEAVKDLSLSDVIAERKILAPKRDRGFAEKDGMSSSAENISLDQVIRQKQNQIKSAQKVNQSLDEIIHPRTFGQKRKAKEDFREMTTDQYVKTPLEVIEELTTDEGLIIENELSRLGEDFSGRTHNWRAKLTCGDISVVVEAPFKDLARQAGAFELLKMIKELYPGQKFSKCRIPEGCFYDPTVARKLGEAVDRLELDNARYETVMTRKAGMDFYISTYYLGEDEFQAEGFFLNYAELFAAKAAYEAYTKTKLRRQNYHVGEKCLPDSNFDCKESEAVHAMSIVTAASAFSNMQPIVPPVKLPEPEPEPSDGDELLVDENGRLYVKSTDGCNKIRRLMKLSDLCPDQVVAPTTNLLASNGVTRPSLGLKSVINSGSDRFPTLEEDELDN